MMEIDNGAYRPPSRSALCCTFSASLSLLHIGSKKAADGSAKGPHVENETPAELNNWSGVYSSYGMQEHKYLLKFVV